MSRALPEARGSRSQEWGAPRRTLRASLQGVQPTDPGGYTSGLQKQEKVSVISYLLGVKSVRRNDAKSEKNKVRGGTHCRGRNWRLHKQAFRDTTGPIPL